MVMKISTIFLTLKGVYLFLLQSRKPKAVELAKKFGINIFEQRFLSKEQDTIVTIMQVFKGTVMIDQYSVDNYRADLYFPGYKLAIECDEFGHKDRDIGYEVTRQKYIENKLNCIFICYNPDAKDFKIADVLNKIFVKIKAQNE